MVILRAQRLLLVEKRRKLHTHPLPQVVGENEVPGEGVGEGRVEFQHFLQGVPLDHMEVTVGQGPHIGKIIPFAATWMGLDIMKLNEVNQRKANNISAYM